MSALTALGHQRIVEEIQNTLQNCLRPVVVVDGPAASGKTSILEGVASSSTDRLAVKFLRGDRLERDIPEHVLSARVERISRRELVDAAWETAEDVKSVLSDGTIPFGRLVHRTLSYAMTGIPAESLSDTQQRFLAKLVNALSRREPLLICDDLQYWDHVSLQFLRRILRGDFDRSYKRLKALSVVIAVDIARVATEDADLVSDILARAVSGRQFKLRRPTEIEFGSVLRELGFEGAITDKLQNDLYAITGGNLALTKALATYLNEGGELSSGQNIDVVRGVFETYLSQHRADGGQLRELVSNIVASGRILDFTILACLIGCSKEQANRVAKQAALQLRFLSVSEDAVAIAHDSVRLIIASLFDEEQRERHQRMADCIRRIRPGDYGLRAAHLEAAGDEINAAALRVMERISGLRSGRYGWRSPAMSEVTKVPAEAKQRIESWASSVDRSFAASGSGEMLRALALLDEAEADVPDPLPLEISYLRAQLLSDMSTDANVERALGILDELELSAVTEEEILGRAREIRIICLSNLRRLDEGRKAEAELRQFYQKRTSFDPNALFGLNRLRRRSEAIHIPEVANDRLKLALGYFGPPSQGEVPIHWAEYLATLNNLCANELVLGRFEIAAKYASQLSVAATQTGENVLRRPEYIWSNVLLTQLLSNTPAGELRAPYEAIRSMSDRTLVDSMLLEINLAAIRAEDGATELAFKELASAFEEISQTDAASPYVRHFASSSLAVLSWLIGADGESNKFSKLASLTLEEMRNAEYSFPFLKRRLEIVSGICRGRKKRQRLLTDISSKIRESGAQVGPSWRFFGRALLLTDIQYWSDP